VRDAMSGIAIEFAKPADCREYFWGEGHDTCLTVFIASLKCYSRRFVTSAAANNVHRCVPVRQNPDFLYG
jgi:hypothetical protein